MTKRDRRRKEIAAAARDILCRDGVEAFTLDAVAGELGLTKQAMYYYFPDKASLIHAALTAGAIEHAEALLAAVRDAEPKAVLGVLVRTFVAQYRDSLGQFRLEFVWPQLQRLPGKTDAVTPKMVELNDAVEEKLEAAGIGESSAQRRRLALLAWTSALGLLSGLSLTDDGFAATTSDLVTDLAAVFAQD